MKPTVIGSPVYSVYRIISVLRIVWSTAATEVTHSSDKPYLTNAAGPTSHSPLPIDDPRRIAPGPITPRIRSPRAVGGGGSSPLDQGGRPERDSRVVDVTGALSETARS